MPRSTDARKHALQAAERLFRTQGYAATGLTQILEESGAPKGSFYFHFPGGKEQLALEVLERYGTSTQGVIDQVAEHCDPGNEFVSALCRLMASEMRSSDWTLGCAAQNLAQELAPTHEAFTAALQGVFERWTASVARGLGGGGGGRGGDRRSRGVRAGRKGARTLARVARSTVPFDAVAAAFSAGTD
jgi:TetR/AcrR family transcriptional regulator, lmrAB and yxaGH operons repressor